mgnify:FL=1|jgi:hypothetical protein
MHKLILALFLYQFPAFSQRDLPFTKGESLEYKIHYGPIDAGKATLKVQQEEGNYWFVAEGKSIGMFNLFFKVRDYYESIIDTNCTCPIYFTRNVREGNYTKRENVFFNDALNRAETTRDTIGLPDNYQDILSVFYYLRSQNLDKFQPGDTVPIQVYLDDEFMSSNLSYLGRDTLKTKFGYAPCTMWAPQLEVGRVFDEKNGMKIWVSDDANKIPLRIETPVLVGSIKMDLVKFSNLKHPLHIHP